MRVQMTYVNVDETASEQPPVAATSSESETQWTRLLSEGSLALLVLIFIVSPARSDPFLIGPVIALYALREDDRRALLLYALLSMLAIPLDLGFVFSATADMGWRNRARFSGCAHRTSADQWMVLCVKHSTLIAR